MCFSQETPMCELTFADQGQADEGQTTGLVKEP